MIAGLTKAFLGVGNNRKELSFSDHTHSLPDLDGILTVDKGGTGVNTLEELKTALNIPTTDYTMQFQVADYYMFSNYRIQVPTNVFAGIWVDSSGLSMLIDLCRPDQSNYYYYTITANSFSTSKVSSLTTEGNYYLLSGVYGIFWYPA